jgi:hypothetical protein
MQPPASDTFRRPLGVFWDIENCSIPRGKSALAVCEKIRGEDFCLGHSEIQFAVVCDATKESPLVLDDLLKAQVGRGTRTDKSYLIFDWLAYVFRIRIWIRIHMFLGHKDPDPLVRGMDPDPDPSIIKQK